MSLRETPTYTCPGELIVLPCHVLRPPFHAHCPWLAPSPCGPLVGMPLAPGGSGGAWGFPGHWEGLAHGLWWAEAVGSGASAPLQLLL